MSDIARTNTSLDDIASVIGFTATIRLSVFCGDRTKPLYVPETADPEHELAALLGMPAFTRLVACWGRQHLSVGTLHQVALDRRLDAVRRRLLAGVNVQMIAGEMDLSPRRVQQIRRSLEDAGLIPLILGQE